MCLCGKSRSGDGFACGRTCQNQSANLHQLTAGPCLKFTPLIIRTAKQRDIIRVLEVRLTNNSRIAMRTALGMPGGEAVEPQHPHSAGRKMVKATASEASRADHNALKSFIHSHLWNQTFCQIWLTRLIVIFAPLAGSVHLRNLNHRQIGPAADVKR